MPRIRYLLGMLAVTLIAACELVTELDYAKVPCPAERTLCDGQCWDLSASTQHCGACGLACSAYQVCTDGICGCQPPALLCGQICAYVSQDHYNCGTCGHVCALGEFCINGVCGCPGTQCGGVCVDVYSDPANCGSCSNKCTSGICSGGLCVFWDAGSDATDADAEGDADADGDAELDGDSEAADGGVDGDAAPEAATD